MPLVTIKGIAGTFSSEQKQMLIKKITDTMVDFEGEAMRPLTWVIIEEVQPKDWGIAGRPIGVEEFKAIQSGAVSVRDAIGA